MTDEWREADLVAKGLSTRVVRSPTGEMVSFTREALEGVAEQVRSGFIPIVIEHLSLLPPTGRWYAAEVVTAEDGADELVLYGRNFKTLRPVAEDPDPWAALPTNRPTARAEVSLEAVRLEPRNFDTADFARAKDKAPLAVEEENRWSVLPPLDWILVIPVVWGACRFAGSFLDELGRESARAVISWIADLASRAKDGDRDQIITLQFTLPGEAQSGPVIYGFVPLEAGTELSAQALPALDAASPLAELAGAQAELGVMGEIRRAAFMWKDSAWHLAWLVADDDAVRVTNWFLANEPDPARFLGRPLLPEAPPSDE